MKYSDVLLKNLKTDFCYQSQVNPAQVNKIVENFDHHALGTIVVNERADGTLYIVDGQHRVVALLRLGHFAISAKIHNGLNIEEEANLYNALNSAKKKNANAIGKASLRAGEEEALMIDQAVERAGMSVDYDSKNYKYGHVVAYKTLERILKKRGPINLETTINFIKVAFGDEKRYFQSHILEGVSEFLQIYGNELDVKIIIEKLKPMGFDEFEKEVNKYTAFFKQKKKCPPHALADIYNYKKRKGKLNKDKLH